MPIGEFSERSGLSQKRLRTYAAAGLLVPAAVDGDTGYRYYAPGQLRDARVIDALRRAEVPLSDIAEALRDPTAFDHQRWHRQLEAKSMARQAGLEEATELIAVGSASPRRTGRSSMSTLTIASRTETGPARATNQDAVIAADCLAGVADGMGGAPGGEVASSLAAVVVEAGFEGSALSELGAVTRAANAAVFNRGATDSRLAGMGTTLCCAGLLDDSTLVIVNVGDSRAYLWRAGVLRQITEDHTVTAELVRRGQLEAAEAARHPYRHVLTRVLGGGPTVDADTTTIDFAADDLLMLCSDGLSKALSNDEIAALMARGGTSSEVVDRLVDGALAAGGDDDVTVLVARLAHQPAEASSEWSTTRA
jgi:protein phosphatase